MNQQYDVTGKASRAVGAAARTAAQIDRDYQLHQKAIAGAKYAGHQAARINREYVPRRCAALRRQATWCVTLGCGVGRYKVSERAVAGTKAAVRKAKDLNREHQISQKVGTIAKAGYATAKDLNEKYKVTHTIGKTLVAGMSAHVVDGGLLVVDDTTRRHMQGSTLCLEQPATLWLHGKHGLQLRARPQHRRVVHECRVAVGGGRSGLGV